DHPWSFVEDPDAGIFTDVPAREMSFAIVGNSNGYMQSAGPNPREGQYYLDPKTGQSQMGPKKADVGRKLEFKIRATYPPASRCRPTT
ncbi:MAG: hypothetical protein KIA58_09205, partial [Winkia neuii]|uniref:hypothetical protein n=1 Tax=Winkia neuii TaxID=33007 RepID=UPI00241E214D